MDKNNRFPPRPNDFRRHSRQMIEPGATFLSCSYRHKAVYLQLFADSINPEIARVLVIQLGGELECAMSRGWIGALARTAEIDVVVRIQYSDILDILPDHARYHRLEANPLKALRIRRQLSRRNFDWVLCLSNSATSRYLSGVSPPARRIRRWIGPPADPAEIDAVLAVLFGKLGVDKPDRNEGLVLAHQTLETADALLRGFGFDGQKPPPVVAPRADKPRSMSSCAARTLIGSDLPVILLPAGQEIDLIRTLAGNAFFVPAATLPLRAALIQRARMLISNDPPSIELARLTRTPVFELPGSDA